MNKDRVGMYFEKYLKNLVFDEFSPDFLKKLSADDIMANVPFPIKAEDFAACYKGEGLKTIDIAKAIATVLGADTSFKYKENYIEFLNRLFKGKAEEILINEGHENLKNGNKLEAAIYFRAAISVAPRSLYGIYSYALACRELYEESEDSEYTGRFKAEAIEAFELLTELHPDFAFAYYYLGYAYLNMGLYTKAYLVWKSFLEKIEQDEHRHESSEEINEIKERLRTLEDPMKIEGGINAVASGRYAEGIERLSPFINGNYGQWWPMHYYLGIAYSAEGMVEEAIHEFKLVLKLSPSNTETMEELAEIYRVLKDNQNEQKYRKKIEVIRANNSEHNEADSERLN